MNTKIKVTLGRIVEQEIRVMHQGQPVVAGYRFAVALEKLCDDPLPVKDKYAVGKTHKQVCDIVKAYEKRRTELIEKFGTKRSALLAKERAEVEADASLPEHVKTKLLARSAEHAAALEKNPQEDTSVIPASDAEAFKKYEAEMKLDLDEEHELFLDHKVTLLDGTKLSGVDMMAIDELVTV